MPITLTKRLSARTVGVMAVASLAIATTSGVAWAAYVDNMYPTQYAHAGCFSESPNAQQVSCRTDNSYVTYYMDSGGEFELETPDRTDVKDTMRLDYRPTDLDVVYDSSPSFSGSAETDIIYQEGSAGIPSSIDGMTWCNGAASHVDLCDQQYVRIRGNGTYTRGLACHETGHAIGLVHGQQASPRKQNDDSRLGCMKTPVGSTTSIGQNNIDNINGTW